MPDKYFKNKTAQFEEMKLVFNQLMEQDYPDSLKYSHLDLYDMTNMYTPNDWKHFKTHPLVAEWYESEMALLARDKVFTLLNDTGSNNSTAKSQQLGQLLNFLKQTEQEKDSNVYMIYSFVPLNIHEEGSDHVKILESVPDEIADAVQSFNPNK